MKILMRNSITIWICPNKWHAQKILNFSRGGGGAVFKKILKNLRPFFKSTNLIFGALRKYYKDPILSKKFCLKAKFKKKTGQKTGVFGHFWKNFDKKMRFFGAHYPLKFNFIGAKGACRKILRLASEKWMSYSWGLGI